MLSSEIRQAIDSLPVGEFEHELNLGDGSRFQGKKFSYLRTLKVLLSERKTDSGNPAEEALWLRQFRLTRISTWIAILCSVLSVMFGGGWYQERQKNLGAEVEANQRLVAEYLQPVATLLAYNEVIFKELRSPRYVKPNWEYLCRTLSTFAAKVFQKCADEEAH